MSINSLTLPPLQTTSVNCPIQALPYEILVEIFSHLGVKALAAAKMTCKAWIIPTEDSHIWRVVAVRLQWVLTVSPSPYEQMREFLHTQWLANKKREPKAMEKMGFWHLDGTRGKEDEVAAFDYLSDACRCCQLDAMIYIRDLAKQYSVEAGSQNDFDELAAHQYEQLRELIDLMERANHPGKRWARESYRVAKSLLLKNEPHPQFLHKLSEMGLKYLKRAAQHEFSAALSALGKKKSSDYTAGLFYKKIAKIDTGFLPLAEKEFKKFSMYYELGRLYYKNQRYVEAVEAFKSFAEESDFCKYMLGQLYFEGRGVEQSYSQAALYWQESLYFLISVMIPGGYEMVGDNLLHQLSQAWMGQKISLSLFKKLCASLGLLYREGLGVEKNEKIAEGFFQLEAKVGDNSMSLLHSLKKLIIQDNQRREAEEKEKSSPVHSKKRKRDSQ
jgi:TPR repeat protein